MKHLELSLSHIQDARIKIFAHSFGDSDSVIPFDEGKRRITILKALNAEAFSPEDFSVEEQEWMVQNGLLTEDRRVFHSDMQENIGKVLYMTLFPTGEDTEATLRGLIQDDGGLHIQIEVKGDVGKHRLFDYPWELLFNRESFLAERGINISRYIASENTPPELPPLKHINVLLVSSRAFDLSNNLNPLSDEEHRAVRNGLENARVGKTDGAKHNENVDDYIHIDELPQPVTFKKLLDYLVEHTGEETPHIIHFDGHGHFGLLCQCRTFNPGVRERCRNDKCSTILSHHKGYLLFEDDVGKPDYISAEDFAAALGNANRYNETDHGITVVVLSACKSSLSLAENSVFNGVAQRLIYQRIPAVVGMAFTVRVDSAIAFTEQFYRAIRQKLPLVQAVSYGRQAMRYDGNQWYRPVLYMRWKDNEGEGGQIFSKQSERSPVIQYTKVEQTPDPQKNTNGSRGVPKTSLSTEEPLKPQLSTLASMLKYNDETKTKQIELLPIYLLFGLLTKEDIPPEHKRFVARSMLFEIEDIWPEHCELAILPLRDIAQSVQAWYDLLDEALTREYTVEVIELHFSLITPLRLSSELLKTLISLIFKFKEVCQEASSNMIDQRQAIKNNLKALRETLNQVNTHMNSYS
jgi:CHAT domain